MIAALVAFCLSLVTIAVAWLFYRPVLGTILLVLAGARLGGLSIWRGGGRKRAEVPAVAG
jgi:hypothetical protein